MSKFTDIELQYLSTQRLGRLATINKHGEPQIAPVTYVYNTELDTLISADCIIRSHRSFVMLREMALHLS